MFDLAAYHAKRNPPMALSRFFSTKGFKTMRAFLLAQGLTDRQISYREKPHKGTPTVAMVHPTIVVEYLRWADMQTYMRWVYSKMVHEPEQAQAPTPAQENVQAPTSESTSQTPEQAEVAARVAAGTPVDG